MQTETSNTDGNEEADEETRENMRQAMYDLKCLIAVLEGNPSGNNKIVPSGVSIKKDCEREVTEKTRSFISYVLHLVTPQAPVVKMYLENLRDMEVPDEHGRQVNWLGEAKIVIEMIYHNIGNDEEAIGLMSDAGTINGQCSEGAITAKEAYDKMMVLIREAIGKIENLQTKKS